MVSQPNSRRISHTISPPRLQRTYNAMQLAAALSLKTTLNQSQLPAPIFLTADKKLLTIAQQAGLPCDNPNNHP